jgi:hypothetical protein
MRHFIYTNLAARAPAAHALGVFMPTFNAMLIAFTGLKLSAPSCERITIARAIALASVAMAAHYDLIPATSAQKHTSRLYPPRIRKGTEHKHPQPTGMCWTKAVQKCHNRIALVSNTVKGAADGTNCYVRAAAAPAYSSGIGAITAY